LFSIKVVNATSSSSLWSTLFCHISGRAAAAGAAAVETLITFCAAARSAPNLHIYFIVFR
jgi:hypothetical protein